MKKYKFDKKEHIHTLDGSPLTGTSSISGVLFKPLSYWASGKACEVFGWTNSKYSTPEDRLAVATAKFAQIKELNDKDYLTLLDTAYKAHATSLKKSAKKGIDLHAELEKFVKSEMGIMDYKKFDDRIQPFIEWSKKNVKKFLASEAHCYSEELWIGGIVDTVAEMIDDTIAVIDFKSSKEAYVTQFLQACGYAIQVEENGLFSADGKKNKKLDKPITKLIVVPFGAEKIVPEVRVQIDEYKKGFRSAVVLYRLLGMDKLITN